MIHPSTSHLNRLADMAPCRWYHFLAALLCVFHLQLAHAAFLVGDTRVIYPAGSRSKTLVVGNTGESPTAVQAWIDTGTEGPHQSSAPFLVDPSVVLLKPGERRVLNIVHSGAPMPQDRESLFWVNLLEVPPVPQKAGDASVRMNIALNLQLKLLYRPASLKMDLDAALDKVTFDQSVEAEARFITVQNGSPFVMSFSRWDFQLAGGQNVAFTDRELTVLPFAARRILLSPTALPVVESVRTQVINDKGDVASRTFEVR